MSVRRATLATTLSRLVVEALVKIGLTQEDVLRGAIEHTNLPWQIPPLVVEAGIFGVPLSEYLNAPTQLDVSALINMFSDVLLELRNRPDKVVTHEGLRAVSYVTPHVHVSERQLYFSVPDGFPADISDYAAATLGLECAHLLRSSARLKDFASDDDNYYAVLEDGIEVGVKGGLPTLYSDIWDIPVSGLVQELLRQPRGQVWEGCDYDIIAKVRSVAFTYKKNIRDFDAVDWSLQALRVIDGSYQLLQAVRNLKVIAHERKMRSTALGEALRVCGMHAITDRQRIELLKSLLVPEIMTSGQFSKQLYNFYSVPPAMLAPKVLARIQNTVQALHDEEDALYGQTSKEKR